MAANQPPLKGGGFQFESAALLAEGLDSGGVGVWRWEVASGRLTWSHNLESIHRLPKGAFDGTFEAFLSDIHAEDRERVAQEIRAALESGESYRVQYRLPPGPSGEVRTLEARGRILRDADRKPVAMTGICEDITLQTEVEAELALRARQHEAVVQLGERALVGAELQEVFDEAVRLVTDLITADFCEILELSQDRDTLIERAACGWQAEPGEAVATSEEDTLAGFALRARTPVSVTDLGAETRFKFPANAARRGAQSGASVTIGGGGGQPFGVLSVYCLRPRCISSTDLRFLQSVANILGSAVRAARDQERRDLLIGELRHRVGNLFSLVQALHRQTGLSAIDARDLEMKFGARLASLASAHTLILDGGWQRASLRGLLEATLAPYRERILFSGSDVQLSADAAFSFSMALHELATNANKYGALSTPHGRLHIETRSEADALGRKCQLVWKEADGPPPKEANDEGFGSKLIAQVVERQLSGHVTRKVEADGLRFTIEFPIA
jgi:two-component sensor histidine kinase